MGLRTTGLIRDLFALAKPNITLLVLITTAGGLWLAPGGLSGAALFATSLGTLGVVIGANALNCYLERESDKLMRRTQSRPLPAGRLSPTIALAIGLTLAALSLGALALWVNQTTTLLAALAFVSYVWVYTPMKRLSPIALVVGAVPGAMPPLMGWTAVRGEIEAAGLALFLILFFWQMPHFIAISIYRLPDYERAGLKTVPGVRGMQQALRQSFLWSVAMVLASLSLTPLRIAGGIYLAIATLLGGGFLWYALAGYRAAKLNLWARHFFLYTLLYLTLLFAALLIDAGPASPFQEEQLSLSPPTRLLWSAER